MGKSLGNAIYFSDTPEEVDKILDDGTKRARAKETMKKVKEAMKINY